MAIFFEIRRGSQNPNAKLREDQIGQLRADYAALPRNRGGKALGVAELGQRYGISGTRVTRIGRGSGWRHAETSVTPQPFNLTWRISKRLGDRKGTRCRILARGKLNSVLVEFEDGLRVITSGNFVRRIV